MGSKPLYQNYMLQINFSIFANISIKHVKIHPKNQMPILIFIIIEYKSPLEFHYKIHNHSINPHILLIVMSFLTLRQQIDNWTLQEDDQVRSSLCSSSILSRHSPMPSSNQKNKSQKIYPKLNIHYTKVKSIWALDLISFSKFLKSNSPRMYAYLYSENLRENF